MRRILLVRSGELRVRTVAAEGVGLATASAPQVILRVAQHGGGVAVLPPTNLNAASNTWLHAAPPRARPELPLLLLPPSEPTLKGGFKGGGFADAALAAAALAAAARTPGGALGGGLRGDGTGAASAAVEPPLGWLIEMAPAEAVMAIRLDQPPPEVPRLDVSVVLRHVSVLAPLGFPSESCRFPLIHSDAFPMPFRSLSIPSRSLSDPDPSPIPSSR